VGTFVAAARRLYHLIPAPPSTNYHLSQLGQNPYDLVPVGGMVLDVGAGQLEGAYAFARVNRSAWHFRRIAVDIQQSGVDICADAHALPCRSGSIDAVVCVSVLEYVRSPERVLEEFYRVLKPGGVIYMSAPFVFPFHPPPADRFRFSISGMRTLASRFDELGAGFNRGPASAFCHVLVHFFAIALSFGSIRLYGVLVDLAKWMFFWLKYLDRWIGRYQTAVVLHGSAFFLGRKPTENAM
jgi:SAM-dependent methyltransferase